MSMIKFIIRRLLTLLPVLFGVITLTFILSRLMPGDPVLAHLPRSFTEEMYLDKLAQLGLDKPIITQYLIYLGDLFTGNWGDSVSISRGSPVWDLVLERFFRTFDIAILSIFIATIVGLKTGVISATHRNKAKDTALRGFALVGVAIPVFWMGMMLQYLFAYQVPILPGVGYKTPGIGDPPVVTHLRIIDSILAFDMVLLFDYLQHLILPVLCLSFITLASITRQTRSSMLEVLGQDYVRTARAKGCREKDVIKIHALKNALIPTITVIGLNFGGLLSGAVLTETTFNLHGLGELLIVAIQNTDYWVLNGIVFLTTITFITINLGIDLLYGFIDPRIRY
ncbi:MAG: ABC transporter permease [Candidatus Thorarchaeota archaeon]